MISNQNSESPKPTKSPLKWIVLQFVLIQFLAFVYLFIFGLISDYMISIYEPTGQELPQLTLIIYTFHARLPWLEVLLFLFSSLNFAAIYILAYIKMKTRINQCLKSWAALFVTSFLITLYFIFFTAMFLIPIRLI